MTTWTDAEMWDALNAVMAQHQQRIADLEAEIERLRAEPTEPTLDEMILAISERKLPFVLQGWGRTWWVDYWDNRTVDQDTPSAAVRAAWEAVCKEIRHERHDTVS